MRLKKYFPWKRTISLASFLAVALVFASLLLAQTRRTKIDLEGTASHIDHRAGTFNMESLKITTTARTRYEDRQDRDVSKDRFFSDLRSTDWLDVEGHLEGSTVAARKIEIEHRSPK